MKSLLAVKIGRTVFFTMFVYGHKPLEYGAMSALEKKERSKAIRTFIGLEGSSGTRLFGGAR